MGLGIHAHAFDLDGHYVWLGARFVGRSGGFGRNIEGKRKSHNDGKTMATAVADCERSKPQLHSFGGNRLDDSNVYEPAARRSGLSCGERLNVSTVFSLVALRDRGVRN